MNQEQLLEYAEKTFKHVLQVMREKNEDYTDASKSNNAFRNFELGEYYGVGSTELGFWYRLSDKFSRLSTFFSSGKLSVKNESVTDTIADMIGYLALLKAYLDSKKMNVVEGNESVKPLRISNPPIVKKNTEDGW